MKLADAINELPDPIESKGDQFPAGWYYEIDGVIPVIEKLVKTISELRGNKNEI